MYNGNGEIYMIYDLIVIGGGPAGINAAIYAKRRGLSCLLLEKSMVGGIIATTSVVDNYLGLPNISGYELANKFFEHLKAVEVPYVLKEVLSVEIEGDLKKVSVKDESFLARNIVVATGRKPKLLDLSNSKKLVGKGISTCAQCDAMFFKGKKVAVVGGGNSAVDEAIFLSSIVDKVYVIHRRNEMRADKASVEQLEKLENVEIIYEAMVTKINSSDDRLESIELNKEKVLEVDGLFMYLGYTPCTEFLCDLGVLDKEGYVNINEKFETEVKGLFACGDIIKKSHYQLIGAANEGMEVAMNIK